MLAQCYPQPGLRRRGRFHGFHHFHPPVDLVESEEDYKILLELPGVNKDDLSISVRDDLLTVAGEKKVESGRGKELNYRHYERSSGKFHRSFQLPHEVDREAIEADYTNGLLTLRLPRAETAKPREIPVKAGK
ncbi:Hsp20/alpha crystallin family protein [candidate division KSB1 bacterium]